MTKHAKLIEAIRSGADSLRTSAFMAGRRGWPVAQAEALEHAEVLEQHAATLEVLPEVVITRRIIPARTGGVR